MNDFIEKFKEKYQQKKQKENLVAPLINPGDITVLNM